MGTNQTVFISPKIHDEINIMLTSGNVGLNDDTIRIMGHLSFFITPKTFV